MPTTPKTPQPLSASERLSSVEEKLSEQATLYTAMMTLRTAMLDLTHVVTHMLEVSMSPSQAARNAEVKKLRPVLADVTKSINSAFDDRS